jgi:hypothetical protein
MSQAITPAPIIEDKAIAAHLEDPEDVKGDEITQVTLTEEDVCEV